MLGVGPRFSVVMPMNSDSSDVTRALVCVLAQTFGDLEVIVVPHDPDCSGLEPVNLLGDDRVTILDGIDPTAGLAPAIEECRGIQVAIIDGATYTRANWLAQCGRALDRTGRRASICGGTDHHDGVGLHISADPRTAKPGNYLLPRRALLEIAAHAAGTNRGMDARGITEVARRSDAITNATAVEHDLVDWHDSVEPTEQAQSPASDQQRLDWIQQGLDVLGASPIPDLGLLGRYATEGAVAAIRLDMHDEARRLFSLARSAQPGELRPMLRWAASLVPGVANICWPRTDSPRNRHLNGSGDGAAKDGGAVPVTSSG